MKLKVSRIRVPNFSLLHEAITRVGYPLDFYESSAGTVLRYAYEARSTTSDVMREGDPAVLSGAVETVIDVHVVRRLTVFDIAADRVVWSLMLASPICGSREFKEIPALNKQTFSFDGRYYTIILH